MQREEDELGGRDDRKQKKSFHYNARIRNLIEEIEEEDESMAERIQNSQPKKSLREKKDRRVAAKETRVRKKMYVELLEKKIEILEKKLVQAQQGERPKKEVVHTIDKLLKDREALFLSLSESVSRKENDKVKDCIDLLQFRYGIAGKDRIKAIEELYTEIVSLLMPMHMRMLIEFPSKFRTMCRGLPEDRVRRINSELALVERAKEKYSEVLARLHESKCSLLHLNNFYQDISNKIREALGTKDIALMLSTINIERSKNQDYQLLFPMSFWNGLNNPAEKRESSLLERMSLLSDNSIDLGDIPFEDKLSLDGESVLHFKHQ